MIVFNIKNLSERGRWQLQALDARRSSDSIQFLSGKHFQIFRVRDGIARQDFKNQYKLGLEDSVGVLASIHPSLSLGCALGGLSQLAGRLVLAGT
jgi:hypothetical protein